MKALTILQPTQRLLPISVFLLASSGAWAQEFDISISSLASNSVVSGTYSLDLTTTVIGDHDPVTNPNGTETVPGLFGGGGNNPIPVDVTAYGPVDYTGPATGGMRWEVDRVAGTLTSHALSWNTIAGSVDSDMSLDLDFSTFRTIRPNSTYFGGLPVTVPGGTQTLQNLNMVQSAPAVGSLTPSGTVNEYDYQITVPIEVGMVVDFNGGPIPVGPLQGQLSITGSMDFDSTNQEWVGVQAVATQTLSQVFVDPLPGFQLVNLPFPVPTVLPPGGTANLLLNGTLDEVDLDYSFALDLQGLGVAGPGFSRYCEVAPNSTGFAGALSVAGSTDVNQAQLTLTATQLPSQVFGIYLMSPGQGRTVLAPPAQGVLCLGAPFFRFSDFIFATDAGGSHSFAVPFQQLPQGQVFAFGSSWNFQAWHRDHNPGPTSNLTHGVTVLFQE